ncbi:hypothetical protein GCM10023237_63710 [Streptomyces coeruleoprunus]
MPPQRLQQGERPLQHAAPPRANRPVHDTPENDVDPTEGTIPHHPRRDETFPGRFPRVGRACRTRGAPVPHKAYR